VNWILPETNHWLVLFASIPVSLSTGTLFVYSVYSTQIAHRCQLDSSQAANLNIFATIGTAVGSIIGGIVTDIYGTQIPMLISSIALFWGYWWLHLLYNAGVNASTVSLLTSMFLIGIGSVSGYFSAIKAVTLHFPTYKGTAQSITIASFAISSLIFSYIATKFSDTGDFLKFLSVICGLFVFVGFVFIRVDGTIDTVVLHDADEVENEVTESSGLLSHEVDRNSPGEKPNALKTLNVRDSLLHPVFWYHYIIFGVVQGLGQMYIYSVGFILKAIDYHFDDSKSLNKLQALHVSIISIASFLGRLSSGPESDYLVHKLHRERHWILILGLVLMFSGHVLISMPINNWSFQNVNVLLLVVSILIGYAYGFSFTSYPAIISDIFNMENYSVIWGCMYTATTIGLTFMTKLFGHVYDSHAVWDPQNQEYICSLGSGCYRETFFITAGLCVFSGILILGYIFHRRV
jgi:MFS family permease